MESFKNASGCSSLNNDWEDCEHGTVIVVYVVALSNEGRKIFEFVNHVAICGLMALFGIAANIINIHIFYKQGFTNTVNIAFLGLAVSDLCCLIALGWSSICINPLLPVYDVTWASIEIMYLTAAWPHVCFCRITSYITVYITAERFISIALPLKVKQIFTARRTTIIICLIFIVNIMTLIPEYATSYLGWRFVSKKNKTLMGILFTKSRSDVQGLCFVIHALLSATSFLGVIIFTFVLVLKLEQTSKWRKDATSCQMKQESVTNKERKIVKMIVLIASVLIICYTPGAIISMAMFVVGPEFNITGEHINICVAAWSVAYSFQSINSSVNIVLYYKMSRKYRQTFNDIFLKLQLKFKITVKS